MRLHALALSIATGSLLLGACDSETEAGAEPVASETAQPPGSLDAEGHAKKHQERPGLPDDTTADVPPGLAAAEPRSTARCAGRAATPAWQR